MNEIKQLNTADQSFYNINREHKDCLFRAVFQEKEDLLELYNAINDTDYQDPDALTVYTLEDAVYMGIKNDLSFLVGGILSLYEHQSTRNPNMPMRGLLYLARNFEAYIEQNGLNMYSSMLQKFPLPQYYVFYNGTNSEPDKRILKLSDAFPKVDGKEACVECITTLLNINYGHNAVLMKKCRTLHDYSKFIHYIRRNKDQGLSITQAVDLAIDTCIDKGVLKKLLVKCRAEVRNMVLSSFDRELYERDLRAESEARGEARGKIKGEAIGKIKGEAIGKIKGEAIGSTKKLIEQVCKKLKKSISPSDIANELEEELSVILKICDAAEQSGTAEGYDINSILKKISS